MTHALIKLELGEKIEALDAVEQFLLVDPEANKSWDVYSGRSGILLGCATLLEACSAQALQCGPLVAAASKIYEDLVSEFPIAGANATFSHGWPGLVYAVLRYCKIARRAIPQVFLPWLLALAAQGVPMKGGRAWETSPGDTSDDFRDRWSGSWCRGSAGLVYVWTIAYDAYGDPAFLECARDAAFYTGQHVKSRWAFVCCGLAGQAYALGRFSRYSSEPLMWLNRASQISNALTPLQNFSSDAIPGLLKGRAGEALLFTSLLNDRVPQFPILESTFPLIP